MAFLGFKKKRGTSANNFDLDMPPEPPKIGLEDDFSPSESPDEELMPYLKGSNKQSLPSFPELPELPGMEEHESLELPPLPDIGKYEDIPTLDDLELPLLPEAAKKEKKGLFSFLKLKKFPKPELPKQALPELPPLPDIEEHELPELPTLSHDEEIEAEEFEEKPSPIIQEQPVIQKAKPQKEKKAVEKPLTRFITLNEFKSIQDSISSSKSSLKGMDLFFSEIDSDKMHQDKKYEALYNSLQDIHRKIIFIDKILFKEV